MQGSSLDSFDVVDGFKSPPDRRVTIGLKGFQQNQLANTQREPRESKMAAFPKLNLASSADFENAKREGARHSPPQSRSKMSREIEL